MTPEEALNLLDNVTAIINGNRQDHENIKVAVAVLAELVEANKKKVEKK